MLKRYGFLEKEGSGPVSQFVGSEASPGEVSGPMALSVHRAISGASCWRLCVRIYWGGGYE